jgi:hypothetical protein
MALQHSDALASLALAGAGGLVRKESGLLGQDQLSQRGDAKPVDGLAVLNLDFIGAAEQRIGTQADASQWRCARSIASRDVGRVAVSDGRWRSSRWKGGGHVGALNLFTALVGVDAL